MIYFVNQPGKGSFLFQVFLMFFSSNCNLGQQSYPCWMKVDVLLVDPEIVPDLSCLQIAVLQQAELLLCILLSQRYFLVIVFLVCCF